MMTRGKDKREKVPSATISRLVIYLRILTQLEEQDVSTSSSELLAEQAQVSAFQVRKDLAYFGRFGTRGKGYQVFTLRRELSRTLGLTRPWSTAIVGLGRLGQAIAHYPHFNDQDFNFNLKAGFDIDDEIVGTTVAGLEILHIDRLPDVVKAKGIDIGFITVPTESAQDAANALVEAGVKGILNFAPTILDVPKEVHVEAVDFLAGLKRLSFYIQNPQHREEIAS
ncbi:MAG: redox-sensing transcriptional repressor Rex [Trueperaceae bacterium]|nr:redox-sensing transcriptional repressor Rex [Trueperaceae bacterium]